MSHSEKTARRFFDNWNTNRHYEVMSGETEITSVAEAYNVQLALQHLHTKNRGKIAGRKIALSSKVMQQMCGIDHPTAGAIFSGDVLLSPATIKASNFVHLGLEFELAIELNSDVLPQTAAHTSQTAYEYIATVRPAFELIEDGNADYTNLDPLTLIADNAWCGGVVLGKPLDDWQRLDLGDIPSIVHQKGESLEKANTGAADPLGSLAWVLNHFSERGITLAQGEHIITGSAVRTRFPLPGDSFTYEIRESSVEISII